MAYRCKHTGKHGRSDLSRRNCAASSHPVGRFSSAVEQRFCKPKVGSSILSTGTTKSRLFVGLFAILGPRQDGRRRRSKAVLPATESGPSVHAVFPPPFTFMGDAMTSAPNLTAEAEDMYRATGRTPRELANDRAYLLARLKLIANEKRGGLESIWYRDIARTAVHKVEGRS